MTSLAVVFSHRHVKEDGKHVFTNVWTPLEGYVCETFDHFAATAAATLSTNPEHIAELFLLPLPCDIELEDAPVAVRLSTIEPAMLSDLLRSRPSGPRVVEVQYTSAGPPFASLLRAPILKGGSTSMESQVERRMAQAEELHAQEVAPDADDDSFEDTSSSCEGFDRTPGRFRSSQEALEYARLSSWRRELCDVERLDLPFIVEESEDKEENEGPADFRISGKPWRVRRIGDSASRDFAQIFGGMIKLFGISVDFGEEGAPSWRDDPCEEVLKEGPRDDDSCEALFHPAWPPPSILARSGVPYESLDEEREAGRMIASTEEGRSEGTTRCTVPVLALDQRRQPWGSTCVVCAIAANILLVHHHLLALELLAPHGGDLSPHLIVDHLVTAMVCDLLECRPKIGRKYQRGEGGSFYPFAQYLYEDAFRCNAPLAERDDVPLRPALQTLDDDCRGSVQMWRAWCHAAGPHVRVEVGALADELLEAGAEGKLASSQARGLLRRLLMRDAPVVVAFRHCCGRTAADVEHAACVVELDESGNVTIVDSHTGGGTCEDSRRVTTKPANRSCAFVVAWHRFYYSWAQLGGHWMQIIVPSREGGNDLNAQLWRGMAQRN